MLEAGRVAPLSEMRSGIPSLPCALEPISGAGAARSTPTADFAEIEEDGDVYYEQRTGNCNDLVLLKSVSHIFVVDLDN